MTEQKINQQTTDHPKISDYERLQRLNNWREAVASVELEGLIQPPEDKAFAEKRAMRYINGEVTFQEYMDSDIMVEGKIYKKVNGNYQLAE